MSLNSFLSAATHYSLNDGRHFLSEEGVNSLLIGCRGETHQALDAYKSLATTTER